MIKTANDNLEKSGRKNISFRIMDNLNMTTPDNYFDIVVARHTCIDAKQIYKTLKKDGKLLIRGVDVGVLNFYLVKGKHSMMKSL